MKKIKLRDTLAITFFLVFGLGVLYYSDFFEIRSWEMFRDYVLEHGFEGSMAILFILVGIGGIIGNIMKLFGKENVLEEHAEKYKDSYFMNLYLPGYDIEELLVLPILYFLLLPGILALFFTQGNDRIIAILYCLVPGFFILYDLIYKINKNKIKKTDKHINEIKESTEEADIKEIKKYRAKKSHYKANMKNLEKTTFFIAQTIQTILVLGTCAIIDLALIYCIVHGADTFTKIMGGIFLTLALSSTGVAVCRVFGFDSLSNFFYKLFIFLFLLYWFGFLIAFEVYSIINKEYSLLIFSISFWIPGILVAWGVFFKKDK